MHEKKTIVTMKTIATITFLDTGRPMLIFYCFLFAQQAIYLVGGKGRAKFFDCPHAPWLRGWNIVMFYEMKDGEFIECCIRPGCPKLQTNVAYWQVGQKGGGAKQKAYVCV